jgi:molybdate transport system substrate-binding protein
MRARARAWPVLAAVLGGIFVQVPLASRPAELSVASASDLQFVLPEVAARYQRETRQHLRLTFGSSGNFFSQIQQGAPFDVFLSADVEYPQRLAATGAALADTLYAYAAGRLVVWTRADSGIDVSGGMKSLLNPAVRRIAIANPAYAPYGRAAVAALEHARVYTAVRPKLVLGENVAQAAQFVQSGNAEVGLLSRSHALAEPLQKVGRYVDVPEEFHPPIRQAGIVVAASSQPEAARAFLTFLRRDDTVRLLRDAGFSVPGR